MHFSPIACIGRAAALFGALQDSEDKPLGIASSPTVLALKME